MEYRARREDNVVHAPSLHFPQDAMKGLGYFFYKSCKQNADKVFQIDSQTDQSETYSSVLKKSIRVAMEMKKMGITRGDVISICSTNNMESVVPVFAATFVNAAVAGVDPSLSVRDSAYLLSLVQPKIIFVEPSAVNFVEDILKEINFKPNIVVMGGYEKYFTFTQFLKEKDGEDLFRPVDVEDPNDMAVILFSSGTTGMPKAIKCTHYGILYGLYGLRQMQMRGNATFHLSSFYWISAYCAALLTAADGGYKVVASKFEAATVAKLFEKYKITFAFLSTNSAYHFTKEHTTIYETSAPVNIIFAGSALAEEQLQKCKSYFPNALVSSGYGQSEASNFIAMFSKATTPTLAAKYPGSVGVPIPGISVKIVDPDTEEVLPVNQQGEIRILSRGVFIGYDNKGTGGAFDNDGYLKTGDIGYFNEDNCLYVCDRLKDMFKYLDWHVVPASVERVIYQHPAVKEAVVLGFPHPRDGDHPMALVVLKDGCSNVNEEDIQEFVNARVLDREKLRAGVRLVTALPRTVTGKIIRAQIRKAVIKGTI